MEQIFFDFRIQGIDFLLDFDGPLERGDDAAVGFYIVHAELSLPAILEPLLADLISPDLIFPDLPPYRREML